jgi:hypothetical protein
MNDLNVHSTLLERADEMPSVQHTLDVAHRAAPMAPLTNQDIRALYVAGPTPQTAALSNELYRMRALLRRTAQFLDLAQQRGIGQSLDITSRNLMRGLSRALESEPAIREHRDTGTAPPEAVYQCQAYEAETRRSHSPAPQPASADHARSPRDEAEERERLFTWKLLPEPGRGAQIWEKVSYRGVVIVRAYDPVQARELAAEKLGAASRASEKGKRAPASDPWRKRSLVRVELVPGDDAYHKITVPSVVYP